MENPFVVNSDTEWLSRDIEDYPGGIIIPVDKPYRWTSADVVRKIKFAAVKHFRKRNLKVGHAGTLDPLATGVLLVCIGNATKLAMQLQDHDKEYIAGVSFGATTPSYDLEKDIDRLFPYEHITRDSLEETLRRFVGEQEQVAPLFSAKSVDGVRAYELARKLYKQQTKAAGVYDAAALSIIRTSRIRIDEVELLSFCAAGIAVQNAPEGAPVNERADTPASASTEVAPQTTPYPASENSSTSAPASASDSTVEGTSANAPSSALRTRPGDTGGASGRINVADTTWRALPHADIRLVCSKGTYIRAFARDLGEELNSGAHLNSLRRSRSGTFLVSRCITIDKAIQLLAPDTPAETEA